MKSVIICGAGIGGLTTAIYLKNSGYDVTVFEKNNSPGGKMGEFKKDGFRFDTGPSLITMPHIYDEFFKSNNIKNNFELKKLDITCRYFWNDGTVFNYYSDEEKLNNEISKVFGIESQKSFEKYLSYAEEIYNLSIDSFLNNEFNLKSFLNLNGLKNIFKFVNFKSLHSLNKSFFDNYKLINIFDRFATYNGSNPYSAPSLFCLIAYVETKLAPYYPVNGIYSIANCLYKNALDLGIKFNFNSELKNLNHSGNKIKEITVNDTEINTSASEIILNFTNYENNIDDNSDYSCSGFVILAGVKGNSNQLTHHNILFSDNYKKEFDDIFIKKIPADDMTIYISISSKTLKSDAPEFMENWFILVNVPNTKSKIEWNDEQKSEYKNKIYDRIEKYGFNIKDKIIFDKIISPPEFKNNFNSEFGSLYGVSSNSFFTLMKRPLNKSKKFTNLYFTGGNTHPGGGVPLCFLSGKIVANLVKMNKS
ncbi:MAG: phytoene desaturase [Ignavibacteria bacterium]|nr:phytoene desaturase [Ignavibacteria bacterium]